MKTSSRGVELIKKWEGVRLKSYRDVVGVWTIGYGHTKTTKPHQEITLKQAHELLEQDIRQHEVYVNRYVKVGITQNQYDALSSFVFNLGGGALQKSTLLKKLNQGDYKGAGSEFLKWTKAGGRELKGLVDRRKEESEMFLGEVV